MTLNKDDLLPQLKEEDIISIISHIHPDGDSIGSILSLGIGLKKICKQVYIFINDELPEKYYFLPGVQDIQIYDKKNNNNYDICFVLDCADPKRLGYSQTILNKSNVIVNIDHHVSNVKFGDVNIIDLQASSTCEIVFNLLKAKNISIDVDIATCLYTGIATDTGNFIYDNTTPKTHKIVAELMEYGINLNKIIYYLYQNKPLNMVKFLGHILNRLEISCNGKLATMVVSQEDLEKYKLSVNDVDDLINYARDIQGVEVAILLKETKDGFVKVGFRSKNDIDVSLLAGEFGGGGHKKASGAIIKGSIENVIKEIQFKINKSLGW